MASSSGQLSLVEKAQEESKRCQEVSVKASGVDKQLKNLAKNTEVISYKLERMEKDREELAKKDKELREMVYLLQEKLRETETKLEETKTSLKETEDELDDLLFVNDALKTELSDIKEKYTRSIVENELERNKLKERNEVLNLENDKQAQNYRELAEELDTLRNRIERPSNLPMRQDSSISDASFSPSSGQPLRRMSSASSNQSTFVPTPPEFNLMHLMRLLGTAAYTWYQIGIQLEINTGILNSIQNEKHRDMERLSDTLQYWLNNASSHKLNFDTIFEVLCSAPVNKKDLIPTEFKSKYC